MQFTNKLAALAGGITLSLAFAPVALAEERTCRGTLGAVTVDNLRVPAGATCTLNGTNVKGTVKVERNATLARRASAWSATSRPRTPVRVKVNGARASAARCRSSRAAARA